MSKIVELYVKELTREGSTKTINDVPKKLRKQVEDAIAAIEAAKAEQPDDGCLLYTSPSPRD